MPLQRIDARENERVAKLARALRSEKPVAVGRRTAYRAARDYIDLGPANLLLRGSSKFTLLPFEASLARLVGDTKGQVDGNQAPAEAERSPESARAQ